eukprot:450790-Pyramimonas_sp.AAC.1
MTTATIFEFSKVDALAQLREVKEDATAGPASSNANLQRGGPSPDNVRGSQVLASSPVPAG